MIALCTDFMEHFTMGTGGHYITILPADWSISKSHDPLPSSSHSEKMLAAVNIQGRSLLHSELQGNGYIFRVETIQKVTSDHTCM